MVSPSFVFEQHEGKQKWVIGALARGYNILAVKRCYTFSTDVRRREKQAAAQCQSTSAVGGHCLSAQAAPKHCFIARTWEKRGFGQPKVKAKYDTGCASRLGATGRGQKQVCG